jgi:hypothetical protein
MPAIQSAFLCITIYRCCAKLKSRLSYMADIETVAEPALVFSKGAVEC